MPFFSKGLTHLHLMQRNCIINLNKTTYDLFEKKN